MGVRYTKDGKIQDLHFTINLNYDCNLFCNYCPLINEKKYIDNNILDYYINFICFNKDYINLRFENIVIIFFGGEPLLSFDKILYFIDLVGNKNIKYVIYTNGLLINDFFLKKLKQTKSNFIFYISIDGDFKSNKKSRKLTYNQFNLLLSNIEKLKKENINFSFTKVILRNESSKSILNSLEFLNSLNPTKLDFIPEAFSFIKVTLETKKNLIKGIDDFIEKLKKNFYMSELEILEYLGLPDTLEEFKYIYQIDFGFYGDIDGNIYCITDALNSFRIFNKEESKNFLLGNIKDFKGLLKVLDKYTYYSKKFSKKVFDWYKNKYIEDFKISKFIGSYFIKKLFLEKFKPQDQYIFKTFKRITLLEKYYYSDEIYPHEKTWYFLKKDKIYENWKNFLIKKDSKQKIGLVINIPFCETKCIYCTHEIILGNSQKYNEYLDNLEKEAIYYYKLFKNIQIDSLYIGGGTPTVLSEEQLERLYSILFKYYNLEKLSSNMIEFSPNTYTEEKVKIISKYKVNRVTFGIQDIDSEIMRLNNRIQKKDFIDKLLISLKNNKIEYVNVDIMAGLRGQTFINFKNTLDYCLINKNIDDICLNIYKQTNKVGYINNGDNFLNKEYILERDKMINYWREEYSHKEKNIVKIEDNLYNFDNPNLSILSLGYGVNGHIFGKLYYKYNTLKDYYKFCNKGGLVIGYEIIPEDEVSKYIILNLKENGICLEEMEKLFGNIIYGEYVKKGIDKLNSKGLLSNFEKEGKIYYRFNEDSQKKYEIYSKYFYRDEFIKKMKKLRLDMNLEDFLNIYFIN